MIRPCNALFLALVLLAGCAHTRIASREIPSEAHRLSSLAQRTVRFSVNCPVDEIVGHQYLLVALPFGRISIEDPALNISNALTLALAERGIRAQLTPANQAQVVIHCHEISLTAYDYLFFRQIVGKAAWGITVRNAPLPEQVYPQQRARRSVLKAFALYSQLEYLWHQLLLEVAHTISSSPAWEHGAKQMNNG